jgi:hypothetical protein
MNEDNAHFYANHPSSDMTAEGVDRLVDTYAENTQVAGIMFCVNVQRALFASKAWEPLYVDYDPEGGPDQPCLAWLEPEHRELKQGSQGRQWLHNLLLLEQRGIDHHARWLARCRHHGIEGWLSMRMNDCHYNKESEDAFWHPTLWKERPDLRRAPYRTERSWEGAFDYGKEEVREHHLKLIRELFERFDMYGFEMDWMRWGMNFAPGQEQKGLKILTEFVQEVKLLAEASARRVGHPVKVGARIPARPEDCLALGYDVIAWAEQGLIDQIVLSSMLGCTYFDYPIRIWRRLLGDKVRLVTLAESCVLAYPSANRSVCSYEFTYGSAASALERGADGIYLFNECYRESDKPELLHDLLTHVGDLSTIAEKTRRHVVSYPQVHAAGDSAKTILPIPLIADAFARDFGRMEENITLRIPTGPSPEKGKAWLHLGFSRETPELNTADFEVRLNGSIIESCESAGLPGPACDKRVGVGGTPKEDSDPIGQVLSYFIPVESLQSDLNVIEFVPPQVSGELTWAEIAIVP